MKHKSCNNVDIIAKQRLSQNKPQSKKTQKLHKRQQNQLILTLKNQKIKNTSIYTNFRSALPIRPQQDHSHNITKLIESKGNVHKIPFPEFLSLYKQKKSSTMTHPGQWRGQIREVSPSKRTNPSGAGFICYVNTKTRTRLVRSRSLFHNSNYILIFSEIRPAENENNVRAKKKSATRANLISLEIACDGRN